MYGEYCGARDQLHEEIFIRQYHIPFTVKISFIFFQSFLTGCDVADKKIQCVQARPKCDWSEYTREKGAGLVGIRLVFMRVKRLYVVNNNASTHSYFFFHLFWTDAEEECYRQG